MLKSWVDTASTASGFIPAIWGMMMLITEASREMSENTVNTSFSASLHTSNSSGT